jgi:hypothetical protein
LNLFGYEFVNGNPSSVLEIKSGKDHIIILRKLEALSQTKITWQFLGEQRPLSDTEIIAKTRL